MAILERSMVPRDVTLFTLLSAAQRLREQMESALAQVDSDVHIELMRASFTAAFTAAERKELARLLAKI